MARQIKRALPFDKETVSVALSNMDTDVVPVVLPAHGQSDIAIQQSSVERLPRLMIHHSWYPVLLVLSCLCLAIVGSMAFYTCSIIVVLLHKLFEQVVLR